MILEKNNFYKEIKKIRKNHKEQEILERILNHIKMCQSYEELCNNPISRMYGFEALKHQMDGYYSFNLCKNSGVIRLICSINKEQNIVNLEFISTEHYEDFKRKIN